MTTPLPIRFDVWLAALDSGYAPLRAFVAWASARWLANPRSPQWVFRLAMARDVDQAKHALRKGRPEADEWAAMRELLAPDEWTAAESVVAPSALAEAELHLGFLYLRYEAGELSLAEMFRGVGLRNVADEIDRYGNRGGGPTPPGPHLSDRVPTLFAPMAATARAAIPHLPPGGRAEPGPTP